MFLQYLLLGLGDLYSLKQIILTMLIQIKKFSSLKITMEFFWFPLLERCYSIAAFTCWWTFERSLSSFFFFEGRHEAVWLLICFSANPFSVAFKPAIQLHPTLKEGKSWSWKNFLSSILLDKREKTKIFVLLVLWRKVRNNSAVIYSVWFQAAGQSAH